MWKNGKRKGHFYQYHHPVPIVGERDGMLLSMIGKYRKEVRRELIQKVS
jgi:hypothetical protein